MKVKLLLFAFLFLSGSRITAVCGPGDVASASVSGWNGCSGNLNMQFIPHSNSTWLYTAYTDCGVTCPNGSLSYHCGCYAPQGSVSIGITTYPVTQPTLKTFSVYGLEYSGCYAYYTVLVQPGCTARKACPTGRCPGQAGGTNAPSSTATCGETINPATGNTYIDQTDVRRLPGKGPGLLLERTWNSLWPKSLASRLAHKPSST